VSDSSSVPDHFSVSSSLTSSSLSASSSFSSTSDSFTESHSVSELGETVDFLLIKTQILLQLTELRQPVSDI
jgi:hypothetical protein